MKMSMERGTLAALVLGLAMVAAALPARAGMEVFHEGPVIAKYGRIASVENEMPLPEGTELWVRFDISEGGAPGTVNRSIDSVARFLNMHVAAGVPPENIHLAVVVHGSATLDMTNSDFYAAKKEKPNANSELIGLLVADGVTFYQCGQSAAFNGVGNDDLLPGVTMALSAMTAHALLDAEGYSLNPFQGTEKRAAMVAPSQPRFSGRSDRDPRGQNGPPASP